MARFGGIVSVTKLYGEDMAEDRKEALPDIETIRLPEADLADIATESLAQSAAAFRSLMKRYEEAITASELDVRRLYFILGEVLAAWAVIDGKFKKEAREGKPPSMPYSEATDLGRFVERIQRTAIQKVARRYPYTCGPFVEQIREWAQTLPDSEEKKQYLGQSFAASRTYDAMMIGPGGIPLLIRDFIVRSEAASEAFGVLWLSHGAGAAPPGLPPQLPPRSGGGSAGGDGDLGRRVTSLESTVEAMAKDVHAMALGMATLTESIKHLATKEDMAQHATSRSATQPQGVAAKEDLIPLATDIAWMKERLKHVPTKFGLLMAVSIPVASGLWWIFQQIFTSVVK